MGQPLSPSSARLLASSNGWRIAIYATVLLAAACSDEAPDAFYATQAEAVAAGAVGRGWVPDWVPTQATDLREVHDLDTNESALLFTLPSTLNWRPPAACRVANAGEFQAPPFTRAWLPKPGSNYAYFSCPATDVPPGSTPLVEAVAIERSGRHVLHWRVLSK